jgi:hypothetical protein
VWRPRAVAGVLPASALPQYFHSGSSLKAGGMRCCRRWRTGSYGLQYACGPGEGYVFSFDIPTRK